MSFKYIFKDSSAVRCITHKQMKKIKGCFGYRFKRHCKKASINLVMSILIDSNLNYKAMEVDIDCIQNFVCYVEYCRYGICF